MYLENNKQHSLRRKRKGKAPTKKGQEITSKEEVVEEIIAEGLTVESMVTFDTEGELLVGRPNIKESEKEKAKDKSSKRLNPKNPVK